MEQFSQPNNDAVDFTLEEFDAPANDAVDFTPTADDEEPGFDIGTGPADIPLGLNLPLQPLNLASMQMGVSMLLIGLIATMWGAIAWVRAYAAGVVLAFAMIALIMSGLLNIGLEVFWATIVLSLILLVAGVVVQWTR